MFRKTFFLGTALFLFGFASAPARGEAVALLDFRVGAVGAYRGGAAGDWFPQVAWTPSFDLSIFAVRGELGFTALRDRRGNRVGVSYFEALLQYGFSDVFTAEFGGGFHTWGGGTGTNPAVSLGLTFTRVYVGYTHLFQPGSVNEYKVGVKFDIY